MHMDANRPNGYTRRLFSKHTTRKLGQAAGQVLCSNTLRFFFFFDGDMVAASASGELSAASASASIGADAAGSNRAGTVLISPRATFACAPSSG